MLDFSPLNDQSQTFAEFAAHVSKDDLYATTNALTERMLTHVNSATDADIAFEPHDPNASDPGAVDGEETIGWTVGHIIAHTTASNEEAAAHALELARGVVPEGRSRSEVPWRNMDSSEKAVQRLQESRRMCLAMLDAWPDQPDLTAAQDVIPRFGPMNAISRYILGIWHQAGHIDQLEDALKQAQAAR